MESWKVAKPRVFIALWKPYDNSATHENLIKWHENAMKIGSSWTFYGQSIPILSYFSCPWLHEKVKIQRIILMSSQWFNHAFSLVEKIVAPSETNHCKKLVYLTLACAARVTVLGLCVCQSVCQQLFWHYKLRGGQWAIPTATELREPEK